MSQRRFYFTAVRDTHATDGRHTLIVDRKAFDKSEDYQANTRLSMIMVIGVIFIMVIIGCACWLDKMIKDQAKPTIRKEMAKEAAQGYAWSPRER